ncbi:MAG: dihydrolipoyl dehydrogenase [Planctomycetes bacterium]|nr:dihydrolipoyl dehydrogenase [Planctomycetota bacterium]
MSKQHDLIVIGAGPGGYVAAIRAAQLGLDVACIEREPALGGTCLRVGCIPSKALLESSHHFEEAKDGLKRHGVKVGSVELDLPAMLKHKDSTVSALTKGVAGLFTKNKITRYEGTASFTGPGALKVEGKDNVELTAKHIIIATGSKVAQLRGIEMDGDSIGDSTTALSYAQVPEHLVIIGAGVIGLELGSVWLRLGAKVTVLEYLDHILPGLDDEISKDALKIFKKQGFEFRLNTKVTGAKVKKKKVVVSADGMDDMECDRLLVAVGRWANTDGLALDKIGLQTNKRGQIEVNEHFETAMPGVYAIGDVIPGLMLAHKAEDEGVACVEHIVTGVGHVNYNAIPGIVYTNPEIAGVGKTEKELKDAGVEYNVGKFNFMANGRARAMGDTTGWVKILADKQTDRVLGAHIIGPRAGELIAEIAVAMEFGASAEDIARSCHAHPTLAECVKEAALGVAGRTIHM